ncbi:MAG: cytochrome c biogenesis protein CcmG/thiol:disulfide interchange protein DsbE [Saprospiraceae bacterium]|jgi:cytochrome c biogenesis protein CcmG/thiol:disulfide interchange protein DsbE
MNKIFGLLLVTFFFFSCNQNPEAQTPAQTSERTVVPETPKPTPVAEKTTTTQRRSNYAVNTSRPAAQIEKDYPFNIDLTNAKKETFNTEKAFKKNGKPTVLIFWLTTCIPCHYELAAMKNKYAGWQKEADFNFYAISTDFQKNYGKFIAQNEKYQWPWEVYHDTNREFRSVMPGALNGLPQSFILDKNGEIVYHKRKYSTGDEDRLFAKVKELAQK